MYAEDSDLILRRCRIFGNEASVGAGLSFFGDGTPLVADCEIYDNHGPGTGGGIQSVYGCAPTLRDCLIHDNSGGTGGGLGVGGASVHVVSCRFENNTANFGGAIGLMSSGEVIIEDCSLVGNGAAYWGGALSADGSEFVVTGGCMTDNTTSGDGGAAYLLGGAGTLNHCTFADNSADGTAGGVFCEAAGLVVNGCVLAGNGLALYASGAIPVDLDARYNWWGHASGPYHPTLNPGGQGDTVGDRVAFAPWSAWSGVQIADDSAATLSVFHRGDGFGVAFSLPESGAIDLVVFDLRGRRVTVLATGPHAAGDHCYRWRGDDRAGRRQAAGVYLVRLTGSGRPITRKALLLD